MFFAGFRVKNSLGWGSGWEGDASTIRLQETRLWGHCRGGHGVGNFDLLVKAQRIMYLKNLFWGQIAHPILLQGVAV